LRGKGKGLGGIVFARETCAVDLPSGL